MTRNTKCKKVRPPCAGQTSSTLGNLDLNPRAVKPRTNVSDKTKFSVPSMGQNQKVGTATALVIVGLSQLSQLSHLNQKVF